MRPSSSSLGERATDWLPLLTKEGAGGRFQRLILEKS
jgi:hypothetical protein